MPQIYVIQSYFVHFSFFIRFGGTGNGNQFKIGGLPFNSASSPYSESYNSAGSIGYSNAHFNIKKSKNEKYTSVSVKIIAKDPDLIITNYMKVAKQIENVILL